MSKEMTAKGKVTDKGEFKIYESEYFKGQVINAFKGKDILLTVVKDSKKVSNPQINYYFGVVVKLIQDHFRDSGTKYSRGDIDKFLRKNFLFEEDTELVDFVSGEVEKIPHRLKAGKTKVTTGMMMDFFTDVQQWATENIGLYIPDPNEEVRDYVEEQNSK